MKPRFSVAVRIQTAVMASSDYNGVFRLKTLLSCGVMSLSIITIERCNFARKVVNAMINGKTTILATLLIMMVPNFVQAVCTDSDLETGWLWNYNGTIGDKYRVRLTLTRTHGEVSGVYFYSTQLKDIRVKGRIFDGGRIDLDELDTGGRVTARFEAEFPTEDPRGKLHGTLHCEVIVGSWHKIDTAQTLPVYLSLADGTSGTLEHMYAVAGAQDDSLVNRRAFRFWQAVEMGDKATVASLIAYPIKVHVAGGVLKTIRSRNELMSQYDAIFSPAYRKAISDAMPRNMFARDQGIMLGRGEVWFDANGEVIALNN